jgi:RNA polymerase sigma factor (sigma-70 family)
VSREATPYGRLLRVNCSGMSDAEARKHLATYGEVVKIVAKRLQSGLVATAGIDVEDLVSVGNFAVLEAVQTYKSDAKASLRTWVGQVVRWRMAGLLEMCDHGGIEVIAVTSIPMSNHGPSEGGGAGRGQSDPVRQSYRAECFEGFEEQLEAREALSLIGELLTSLPMRSRDIFYQRLAGTHESDVATSLGLSLFRVRQLIAQLRQQLRDGLPEEVLVAISVETAVQEG